jgi:hypothetical protein
LSRGFFLQVEIVFYVNCCHVLVIYFLHLTGFRNKVLFPTSGIRALVQVEAMTGEDGNMLGIEKFDGTDKY